MTDPLQPQARADSAPIAPRALPDRRAVLAASAPWLGALLNVLPGLGAGYLYQRRWRPWWITSAAGAALLLLPGALGGPEGASATDAMPPPLLLGAGLLLAAGTAIEAFLAARRARID